MSGIQLRERRYSKTLRKVDLVPADPTDEDMYFDPNDYKEPTMVEKLKSELDYLKLDFQDCCEEFHIFAPAVWLIRRFYFLLIRFRIIKRQPIIVKLSSIDEANELLKNLCAMENNKE